MNDEIESGEAPTSANHGIFSYKGEISRGKFVFLSIFLFLVSGFIVFIGEIAAKEGEPLIYILTSTGYAVLSIIGAMLFIKRCESIDISPYHIFWALIPLGVLPLFFYLIFAKKKTNGGYTQEKARKTYYIVIFPSLVVWLLCVMYVLKVSFFDSTNEQSVAYHPVSPITEERQKQTAVPKEKVITETITVSGHYLSKTSIYVNGITNGSVTFYKDWLCVTCAQYDAVRAFGGSNGADPEYLVFVRTNQQANKLQNGYLIGYSMEVARRGAFLKGNLSGTRTDVSEYEVDCRNKRLRLLTSYLYSGYFLDSVPFKTINWVPNWIYPQNNFRELSVIEQTCRK
jgi:uncharacterized membrane protein YhaH (DUF805 family)